MAGCGMSALKVAALGRTWKLQKPDAALAWYERLVPIARPRHVLGCERCKMLCVIRASDCSCCAHYGQRTAGGTKSYPTITGGPGLFNFDPSAPGHKIVLPWDELLLLITEAV